VPCCYDDKMLLEKKNKKTKKQTHEDTLVLSNPCNGRDKALACSHDHDQKTGIIESGPGAPGHEARYSRAEPYKCKLHFS